MQLANISITVRSGHPDFLDLPWDRSLVDWVDQRLIVLPKGISRHEVRFLKAGDGSSGTPSGAEIYAIKELPAAAARQDYDVLRGLELRGAPAVTAVGIVDGRLEDPTQEASAALITRYVDYSFSFRELLEGPGFGRRRSRMLAAFAGLLVELHLAGCFWGDCSLSNVLYRYDAAAIKTFMVDAETAVLRDQLSPGQRTEDLEIMTVNVAGGMADIAAAQGVDLDGADLALGEAIEERYRWLWDEVTHDVVIPDDERWRITERIRRLNELGFTVDEIDLEPAAGGQRIRLHTAVGNRSFHSGRLSELTGVQATEWQARHLLADLYRFQARHSPEHAGDKHLAAINWRVGIFEPTLARIRLSLPAADPMQGYCDFLHFRFEVSRARGIDVADPEAYAGWEAAEFPGFPLEDGTLDPL